MERIFGDIQQLIQHNPWLAIVAVFLGGGMNASNPCVLAMIPVMIVLVNVALHFRRRFFSGSN